MALATNKRGNLQAQLNEIKLAINAIQEEIDNGGGENPTVTSDDITDATTVGKNVLKATDAAAARTAIGAGTSSLALGTTASTAAAGNHTHADYATTASVTDLAARVTALENA